MPLNQILFLIITIAVVVAVTYLVTFLAQLRRTAREGEETLIEIKELVKNLRETDQKIKTKIDEFGEMIEASKKTAVNLSEATLFLTTKVIRPSSRYWPILFPLLRAVWRRIKKKKGEKNGK